MSTCDTTTCRRGGVHSGSGPGNTSVGAAWVLVNAFILLYEEPALKQSFGADYAEYCSNVGRWIPRLTPFDK